MTETTPPAYRNPRVWDTRDVAGAEAFDYYREGICAAFMPLRPELAPGARADFRSVVRSYPMPDGVLNEVSARSHEVLRTRAEIAASPEPCWYVNLQFDGICGIEQQGETLALAAGEVGLFDSDAHFRLDHARRAGLRVASLVVPKRLIAAVEAPHPLRLTDHPVYGGLIAEGMLSLIRAAQDGRDVTGLHGVLLSLLSLATQATRAEAPLAQAGNLVRLRACIRANAARPGWSLADCAAETGLTARQVQRLLAQEDDGFAAAITRERMALAARWLRDPAEAHRPVADIALQVGYAEASPFSRAFRAAYGVSPGAWRRGTP